MEILAQIGVCDYDIAEIMKCVAGTLKHRASARKCMAKRSTSGVVNSRQNLTEIRLQEIVNRYNTFLDLKATEVQSQIKPKSSALPIQITQMQSLNNGLNQLNLRENSVEEIIPFQQQFENEQIAL